LADLTHFVLQTFLPALALLPERRWDAVLVDLPLAGALAPHLAIHVPRRIVLIRPGERS
jgi:hypothetical protein